jgi:hypothetical protein
MSNWQFIWRFYVAVGVLAIAAKWPWSIVFIVLAWLAWTIIRLGWHWWLIGFFGGLGLRASGLPRAFRKPRECEPRFRRPPGGARRYYGPETRGEEPEDGWPANLQ